MTPCSIYQCLMIYFGQAYVIDLGSSVPSHPFIPFLCFSLLIWSPDFSLCFLWVRRAVTAPAGLQSGFSVTVSVRGPCGRWLAPLRMAWELVSGLPVSTQACRGRLMNCVTTGGQMDKQELGRMFKTGGKEQAVSQWSIFPLNMTYSFD